MGKDQNSFRKNQGRKRKLSPTMGKHANQEVPTLSKEMEGN